MTGVDGESGNGSPTEAGRITGVGGAAVPSVTGVSGSGSALPSQTAGSGGTNAGVKVVGDIWWVTVVAGMAVVGAVGL